MNRRLFSRIAPVALFAAVLSPATGHAAEPLATSTLPLVPGVEVSLFQPQERCFLRINGANGLADCGGHRNSATELPANWVWERFRVVDAGGGRIALYSVALKRFLRMTPKDAPKGVIALDVDSSLSATSQLPADWGWERFTVDVRGPWLVALSNHTPSLFISPPGPSPAFDLSASTTAGVYLVTVLSPAATTAPTTTPPPATPPPTTPPPTTPPPTTPPPTTPPAPVTTEVDACVTAPCADPFTPLCFDRPGSNASESGRFCCRPGYSGATGACVDEGCETNNGGCAGICLGTPNARVCIDDVTVLTNTNPDFPGVFVTPGPGASPAVPIWFEALTTVTSFEFEPEVDTAGRKLAIYNFDATPGGQLLSQSTVAPTRDREGRIVFDRYYTFFARRRYSVRLVREGAADLDVGSLQQGTWRVRRMPEFLDLNPAALVSSRPLPPSLRKYGSARAARPVEGPSPYASFALEATFARPTVITGVRASLGGTAPASGASAPTNDLQVTVRDLAAQQSVGQASQRPEGTAFDVVVPLALLPNPNQPYRFEVRGARLAPPPTEMDRIECGTAVTPRFAAGVATVSGAWAGSAEPTGCLWDGAANPQGRSTPLHPDLQLRTTRLDLFPSTVAAVAAEKGLAATRAYVVRFAKRTTVTGLAWNVQLLGSKSASARIWDASGQLVASGPAVNGTSAATWLGLPVTYTFAAGVTYRVGVYEASGAGVFPRRELSNGGFFPVFPRYTSAGMEVLDSVASSEGGEQAPSVPNAWYPEFRLYLAPSP